MPAKGFKQLVSTAGTDNMINITAPYVVLKNMKILQNYPSTLTTETVVVVNNAAATGIYIDNCEISPCEFGIGMKAAQFQITNCSFTYAPLAAADNSYRYISIFNTTGESIIDNNTFISASGNSRCFFMEEFVGTDFQLYINNNTTISEGNVPILLFNAKLDIFRFIEVINNSVQNTVGKGLIGIDSSFIGTTDIYSSGNTFANPSFTAPWASATVPVSLTVGYDTSVITMNPSLPLAACYWMPLV